MALWHVVDFPDDIDREFPIVERPTFSAYPPAAYRLAEPGDTIDRVGMYLASVAVAMAVLGLVRSRAIGRDGSGLWWSALGLALGLFWFVTNPWPTFDGWHGLGWRVVGDPDGADGPSSGRRRGGGGGRRRSSWYRSAGRRRLGRCWARFRRPRRCSGLLGARRCWCWRAGRAGRAWSRWGTGRGGRSSAGSGCSWRLIRLMPAGARCGGGARLASGELAGAVAVGLSGAGLSSSGITAAGAAPGDRAGADLHQRHATARGLEIAQRRHGFKTIINLFQEDLPGLRSPYLDDEVAFAEEHGIHYLRSPLEASEADAFLERDAPAGHGPRRLADPRPLPRLHGPDPGLVGDLPVRRRGRAADRRDAGDRAAPGLAAEGVGDVALQPRPRRAGPRRYRDDPTAALLRQVPEGTCDPFFEASLTRSSGIAARMGRMTPRSARLQAEPANRDGLWIRGRRRFGAGRRRRRG